MTEDTKVLRFLTIGPYTIDIAETGVAVDRNTMWSESYYIS